MEKFLLIVGSETEEIINVKVDNINKIQIGEDEYLIDYSLIHVVFTKRNKDSIFKVLYKNGVSKATIELKNEKSELDIPIDYINYNYSENGFELTYKLESQKAPLKISLKKCK